LELLLLEAGVELDEAGAELDELLEEPDELPPPQPATASAISTRISPALRRAVDEVMLMGLDLRFLIWVDLVVNDVASAANLPRFVRLAHAEPALRRDGAPPAERTGVLTLPAAPGG
jgi:hypothetical protein